MIKNIVGIFKTIGDGLHFEDAGEMLSYEKKLALLSKSTRNLSITLARLPARVLLVSEDSFTLNSVERAIETCRNKNAILELLYIGTNNSTSPLNLTSILPLLEHESSLDFQLTRRQGELVEVLKNYLVSRQDILMVLISVSEKLRKQAEEYQHIESDFPVSKYPSVKIIDHVMTM